MSGIGTRRKLEMSSLLSGGPKAAPILVHIDMKGGPPTLDYLLQLLPLLKSWGATGILIEWEDMFPYWGTLKVRYLTCFVLKVFVGSLTPFFCTAFGRPCSYATDI